jgi:DEAD/DEAH box helicase domain-containing protein
VAILTTVSASDTPVNGTPLAVTPVKGPATARPATGALAALLGSAQEIGQVTHVEHLPGAPGTPVPWPTWVPGSVAIPFAERGIVRPWSHQAHAANLARGGQHVIIATRAASGKSAAYLAPALTAIAEGGTVLYIAPTKALAADQLAAIEAMDVPRLTAACADGDNTAAERAWARSRASFLLTNPDTLHASILPAHANWRGFFARLRLVIIDECHGYRGVFGSHVAHVVRRLRRVVRQHAGQEPTFVLASATVPDPAGTARLLTGLDVTPVTDDGAPRAPVTFALLNPSGNARDSAARLLARLVQDDVATLAFVRSRREAEMVAGDARELLGPDAHRVAAYRSGYLADERRAIEGALRDGTLSGLAATSALELGVSLPGLDAVLITGWPGSHASLWQQAGRAGRDGTEALVIFIARDDPLDRYLTGHPDILLSRRYESVALDPGNPRVLAPHLQAAAAELPLAAGDLDMFGPAAHQTAAELAANGRLRARHAGGERRGNGEVDGGTLWYGAVRGRTERQSDLRDAGGERVRVVEQATGRLVGTMDEPSAHLLAHEGAVYVHQGEAYVVGELNLDARVALVEARDPGYTTVADQVTELAITAPLRVIRRGQARLGFGDVEVSTQVVAYRPARSAKKKNLSLPRRTLATRAMWIFFPNGRWDSRTDAGMDLAGAAHAVQHAAIALLPLFAACDRSDVSGTWGAPHPATGEVSVFVYDGQDGGSGFAERGFDVAERWLTAVRDTIAGCECECGCPSCVHSPRCGAGNRPLSKRGAIALLDTFL